MEDISSLITKISLGDNQVIARLISLIENEASGYEDLLKSLPPGNTPVIGITGPPGAGKSTLVNLLIEKLKNENNKIAVLCIDPSSPFSHGALLGDRVRMNKWYNDPDVFIRSFATRGSLGGLHPKIIEITELIKAAPFDFIIVETVGVGQSEVEIAGLSDITVVVFVPEAGDDIQVMKAGLIEIADIFVVNKSDRIGADEFVMNLQQMSSYSSHHHNIPVIKTIAIEKIGTDELVSEIKSELTVTNNRKIKLIAERAFQIIMHQKMKHINKQELENKIEEVMKSGDFNLYRFVELFFEK
jgi:LAO/AO transport system kinase